MKRKRTSSANWRLLGTALVLFGFWFSASSTRVEAQTPPVCSSAQGHNAVWGTCQNTLAVVGSAAFVDASAFCPNSPSCDQADICVAISQAIDALPSAIGGVVDARGVVYPTGLPITCNVNPFPQPPNNVPATVLLPPSVIQIQVPWILPSNTRISGQGRQTILRTTGTFSLDGTNAMIEMGTAPGATGVVVENHARWQPPETVPRPTGDRIAMDRAPAGTTWNLPEG